MIAEILSTGDEVLLGDITDTNSSYLCNGLKNLGISVGQITAVGDDVAAICQVLTDISRRADICLVTGGLGPTQDDLTAQACARAAQLSLTLNSQALLTMEAYFKKRGYELNKVNEKQAMLPTGADVIINNWGTAPGFDITIGDCRFFFMPGVPSEMKPMFKQGVAHRIVEITGKTKEIAIERLMVFGLPESKVGSNLTEFETKFPGIVLGFRARFPLIEVKLMAANDDDNEPDLVRAKTWVVEQLENKVISLQGLTLEQEVGRLLSQKGNTLSVAESCTGGLIANQITNVAGSSDYFLFSGVTYANSAKIKVLKVSQNTLETHGAVHENTALEMAVGAKGAGQSDWAVSTTGIAGPSGGSEEKPVGTVCIGVAGPGVEISKRFCLDVGDRTRNKQLFAAMALEMLRRQLLGP